MNLENITLRLEEKIAELEKVIEFRNTSEEWRSQKRDSTDKNEYFWDYGGELDDYCGRLKALKQFREELKNDNI